MKECEKSRIKGRKKGNAVRASWAKKSVLVWSGGGGGGGSCGGVSLLVINV